MYKAAADGFRAHADRIRELAKALKPERQEQILAIADAYRRHAEKLLETGKKLPQ
jgi:hypothetical protein